jgi:hypothetical protein
MGVSGVSIMAADPPKVVIADVDVKRSGRVDLFLHG